jgi:UDP-N-acetyl-D-mannosaminuronic acid dehydrogenase
MGERSVVVVGLGTVGAPTAALLALGGARVTGVDTDHARVESLRGGAEMLADGAVRGLWQEARGSGRLEVAAAVPGAPAYVVSVPTPVSEDGAPDLSYLQAALRAIGAVMPAGALAVVESTLPPGGCRAALGALKAAAAAGAGGDPRFAYAPERVLPGDVVRELRENPRIVGSWDPEAGRAAEELLRLFVRGSIHHATPEVAEFAKLAENAFRMVNIGFANELAGLCDSAGVDAREVIALASLHPRVRILAPGPGVAGPCLPKDPRLLAHGRESGSRLIMAALEANDAARLRVFAALEEALSSVGRRIEGSRVLVLGIAYKGGVADTTASAGLWLARKVREAGGQAALCDPRASLRGERVVADPYGAADGCVATVICTDHPEYRALDLGRMRGAMAERPVLVDARGIIDSAPGFVFRGLGRGTGRSIV